METKDSIVVITGASSGIGRETALQLAKQGAKLVLVARREGALHGLVAECEKLGGKALAVPTDVSIENDVHGVAQKAIERFGKIDVWINNAAVTIAGRFEEIPMEDFRRVLEINLFGYIYGSRAAVSHFKRHGGGIIINIASMVALTGEPYFSPYVISKFAIRGLGISLSQELANTNIHVCTVLPAVIDTPLFNQSANYMGMAVKAAGTAMPAEEVADKIISLIEKPQSELLIGAKVRLAATAKFLAPALFDKLSQKRILSEHFEHEKYTAWSKGNLYEPMKEFAAVSGGWAQNGKHQNKIMKYLVPAALVTGASVGLSFLLKKKS
jgi:short-subunit dehydrogenase